MSTTDPETPASETSAPPDAPEQGTLEHDPVLAGTVKLTAGVGVAATIVAALIMGPLWSIGTFVGGALATVNLLLFIRVGRGLLSQPDPNGSKRASRALILLGLLKLLGLFACVALLVRQGSVSPFAFALGYGALPIAVSLSPLIRPAGSGTGRRPSGSKPV